MKVAVFSTIIMLSCISCKKEDPSDVDGSLYSCGCTTFEDYHHTLIGVWRIEEVSYQYIVDSPIGCEYLTFTEDSVFIVNEDSIISASSYTLVSDTDGHPAYKLKYDPLDSISTYYPYSYFFYKNQLVVAQDRDDNSVISLIRCH